MVWKATDLRSGAVVALKKMREARGQLQHVGRLRREAALLLSFSDPGLPRGIELIDGPDGPVALVLEFIDGQPLHQILRGPLSAALLWPLFLELTRLVALLHARGVAHRDLKQPNILVRPGWEDGVPGSVVLVDFGIARGNQHFATAYTNTGATLGTCAFMAPEILSGHQEPSPEQFIVGDVYALAVVFWSLLTGLLPNGLPLHASLMQLVHLYSRGITFVPEPAQVESIERAVPGLVRVLERCLAYTPQHRFQHAGELLAALRGLQQGVKVDLAPKGASPQAHTYLSDLPTSELLSAPPGAALALAPTVLPETVPEPPRFGPTPAPAPVVMPAPTPVPAPVVMPAPTPVPAPVVIPVPTPVRVAPRGDVGLISKGGVPWFAVGLIAGIGVVFGVVVAVVVVVVGWGGAGSTSNPAPTSTTTVRAVAPKPLPGPVSTRAATRFATVAPPSGNNNGVVRAGPGQQYAEVEQLPRGTLVRVQASDVGDGWCEVESARGRGYMHRNILKFP